MQLAWFLKGDNRAFQTALIEAVEAKILTLEYSDVWSYNRYAYITKVGNPLITTLQCIEYQRNSLTKPVITIQLLQDIMRPSLALITRQLGDTKKRLFRVQQLFSIWLVITLVGVIRVFQGVIMDKPVLYLVLMIMGVLLCKLFLTTIFSQEITQFLTKNGVEDLKNAPNFHPVHQFAYEGSLSPDVAFASSALLMGIASMNMKMPYDKASLSASSCGGTSCGSDGGGSCSGGGDGGGGDGGGCGGCGGGGD